MKRLHPSHPIFYLASLFFGYAVALINGFRMPNLWSINYYIPSMLEGFYRRSLFGNITFFLGDLRFQYHTIALIQLLIFAALNIVIIRACLKSDTPFKWIWLLFLLSPAGGYFFHEVGYIDQSLYLILFIAISSKSKIAGGIMMLASMWVHEMALFTTLPLYIAYLILKKRAWSEVFFVSAGSAALFAVLYIFFQTASQNQLQQFLSNAELHTNYLIRLDYYHIFSNKFIGERFQIYYSIKELKEIALISPLWLMSGYLFSKTSDIKLEKIALFFTGLFASFSPLLLGTFGWDTYRWIFLSLCSASCCIFWGRKFLMGKPLFLMIIFYLIFIRFGFLEYFDAYKPRLDKVDNFFTIFKEICNEIISIPKR